ncbi:SIMPL domain-containing protein [Acidimangrovimonas sediminis]|uniref:SIMPL domain-containing protein n=1 Tax=Acidimangrovimonas sediminis TaxID=2056283 RepID=UPI001E2E89B7|nr:SIMPL domain-containing protein [Acidimangrovimonas sediminis]
MRFSTAQSATTWTAAGALMLALAASGAPLRAETKDGGRAMTGADTSAGAARAPRARITVTGEGEERAEPDMATVSLGVTTEAKTAADAMSRNSAEVTKVIDALKAAGLADRDMQTSGLSLGPRWNDPQGQSQPRSIVGFTASNRLSVRVRDLGSLGGVLDKLVQAGANTIDALSFSVADPQALQDKARAAAVRDARRKAEVMAKAAGVTLGRVLSISDGGGSGAPRPMMEMRMAKAASVPIARGEVGLSANVTVVFALKE